MLHYTITLRIANVICYQNLKHPQQVFILFFNKMSFYILSTFVLPSFFLLCWIACSKSTSSENDAKENQKTTLMGINNFATTTVKVKKLGTGGGPVKRAFSLQSESRLWGWMRPLVYLVIELPSSLLCKVFYILYRIIRVVYNE